MGRTKASIICAKKITLVYIDALLLPMQRRVKRQIISCICARKLSLRRLYIRANFEGCDFFDCAVMTRAKIMNAFYSRNLVSVNLLILYGYNLLYLFLNILYLF